MVNQINDAHNQYKTINGTDVIIPHNKVQIGRHAEFQVIGDYYDIKVGDTLQYNPLGDGRFYFVVPKFGGRTIQIDVIRKTLDDNTINVVKEENDKDHPSNTNPTDKNNKKDSFSHNGDTLIWVNKNRQGTYEVPNGTKVIKNNAFRNCNQIKEIVIPKSLVVIENEAFSMCKNLQSINLPDGLKKIGHKAFSDCESIRDIIIPKSVTEIGDNPFYRINNNIKIKSENDRFVMIKDCFFVDLMNHKLIAYNGSSDKIQIPNDINVIGKYAFANNLNLCYIEGSSILEIMDYAFYKCTYSKRFTLPNVKKMGNNPFLGIHNAPEIALDDNYFIYRDNLLVDKEKLKLICYVGNHTEVDLYIRNMHRDKQLQIIGNCSFYGCEFVTYVKLSDNICSIEKNAFKGCNLELACSEYTKNKIENDVKSYGNKIKIVLK